MREDMTGVDVGHRRLGGEGSRDPSLDEKGWWLDFHLDIPSSSPLSLPDSRTSDAFWQPRVSDLRPLPQLPSLVKNTSPIHALR